jgi:aminomethyltransferase
MKTTPLTQRHIELGAQMTEFAGYQMPVRYTSDRAEHMAVREKAGIFDVSHMGEVWVTGPNAETAISELLNQDASKHSPGRAFYGLILNENLGVVDDVITYKFSPEKFLICVNASNREKDYAWIKAHCDAEVRDASDEWAQIALQGPLALEIPLNPPFSKGEELPPFNKGGPGGILGIKRYHFTQIGDYIIARTGYTGEDGYEIFCPPEKAVALWDELLQYATPCGLAARDTLRLEAGMCLYGHELNDQITPWDAGLGNFVNLPPREPRQKLVGLEILSNTIARSDYEVCSENGERIGVITSGTKTPFLNKAIAMAYIDKPYYDMKSPVYIRIRNNLVQASICALPFYKRKSPSHHE